MVNLKCTFVTGNALALRRENISLKQKFTGLESDKAHLEIKIEEFELKLEQMKSNNIALQEKVDCLDAERNSLNIRLEITKGQLENQTDKLNEKSEEEKVELTKVNDIKSKNSKLENVAKDMSENIVMLESTLINQ